MEEQKMHIKEIKNKVFQVENLLYLLIIICPILDMISFLFRNTFHTSISPSTFLRPILSIICIIYIFFKDQIKVKLIIGFLIYFIYTMIHIILFQNTIDASSFGSTTNEIQFLINYSFLILNLFIFQYFFLKKEENEKLKISIIISISIYLISIFISILTNTSTSTYPEGIGYKGWFETATSIGAILILSLFILLNVLKKKKYRYYVAGLVFLMGIYLTTFIGTRVGLFGFLLVLFGYIFIEIVYAIFTKVKVNKSILITGLSFIILVIILIFIFGSHTLTRRKHLQDMESVIIDEATGDIAHITKDMTDFKNRILEDNLSLNEMQPEKQRAIIDLYNFANRYKISNNDLRIQQFAYNIYLVKNQANPVYILFGNGYMSGIREMILEMEIPAFLLNFGVFGFVLYFIPFLAIAVYACYIGVKNWKKIDIEYIMLFGGAIFAFFLSFLSGYTFFNASTMIVVLVINTLLLNRAYKMRNTI